MEALNGKSVRSTESLGALVRETRKAQGISQEQLAGVANTGIRFISDLENGKPTVQMELFHQSVGSSGAWFICLYRWERR